MAQKEVVRGLERKYNAEDQKCKIIDNMWEVLGRKWALLILRNLHTKEAIRFNELKRLMPGISSTVLAARLLEMEREGLISKKIYAEIPSRVEYRLTARARELGVILKDLGEWAQHWKSPRIPATTLE
ncbi:MAG: winged helix-turn-helix transcriptional regulator [Nitrososphaeraceae archaeon]